jgi:DNA adenine methylase
METIINRIPNNIFPDDAITLGKRKNKRKAAQVSKLKHKKLIAFGWYGGKFSHLEWLLPLLPSAHHYCEPFAGSGAVLLNRIPAPVETYNDIDGEVVNFFKVLRDNKDETNREAVADPFFKRRICTGM